MAYTNTPIHDKRFPGETEKYRKSRDELLRAEMALRAQAEAVALQRRQLPAGGEVPTDYVFQGWDDRAHAVRDVRLSELFGEKDTLFLYSFMFIPGEKGLPLEVGCPSCTSIIDAMDGQAQHIGQQMSFAVEAKAPIELFQAHARTRGWQHARLLSSAGTTYRTDYNSEQEDGEQLPIATIFVRRGSQIRHFWSSELFYAPPDPGQDMRHVDFMWPLWAALDHSPEGRPKDWGPALTY
jgi:predicted dithiol-disulfide oxidoreductase (DUF899 family)